MICDVLVIRGIAEENAGEVVAVQFALVGASAFHAYPRAKSFEVCNVGFSSIPTFVRGLVSCRVNKPVVEVHGVKEGG